MQNVRQYNFLVVELIEKRITALEISAENTTSQLEDEQFHLYYDRAWRNKAMFYRKSTNILISKMKAEIKKRRHIANHFKGKSVFCSNKDIEALKVVLADKNNKIKELSALSFNAGKRISEAKKNALAKYTEQSKGDKAFMQEVKNYFYEQLGRDAGSSLLRTFGEKARKKQFKITE